MLSNEKFIWDREGLTDESPVCRPSERIPTLEVDAAIGKMKKGKSGGPTGVVLELIKATGAGCLQNQANKIPGYLQDFQEFFKQFSRICLHKMSTQIIIVHTIIIWNVQFHLAYFYLTTSLLTFN